MTLEEETGMKKVLKAALAAIVLSLAITASTLAAPAQTDISGYVYNNGRTVSGAKVTVVCDNNARHDTTDGSGAYLVHFPAGQCPDGAKVYVTATKSRKGGENTGNVHADTSKLNVSLINVSLPEFGFVAAGGAAMIAGGAFLVIRRHKLGDTQV